MPKEKVSFEDELRKHGNLVYRNVGVSMMPLLRQGRDLMVLSAKTEKRLNKYDVPLYKRPSGQYVLHRILEVREHDYVICGDHCWQKEYGVTDEQILGVLTAVVRDGETIPVTDWRYRLYVHLWCDFFPVRAAILWSRSLPSRCIRKIKRVLGGLQN